MIDGWESKETAKEETKKKDSLEESENKIEDNKDK